MSEIKTKSQNFPVTGKRDVIKLYEGALTNQNLPEQISKIGMEVELNLYNASDLSPLSESESCRFVCEGMRKALNINTEPSASTLEVITDPYPPEHILKMVDQINDRFARLWALELQTGALPSPFGYLPHVTPAQHHLVQNERYKTLWGSGRTDVQEARESFLDPSIQVSISYRDFDHLLKIIRLGVVLEPFLMLTTEADAGFYEGRAVDGSPRTRILKRRGRNGGVPDFYYSAKSGEELIDAHIAYTLSSPHVFVRFNNDGVLEALPDGVWTSFTELGARGFGPQNLLNYRQAQSMSWRRTTNIAEIRDSEGTLFGHRAELSSLFCTGLQHQRATAAILSFHLAYCGNFYSNVSDLCKDFGIDMDDLSSAKELLDQNFDHAYMHHGRYHDLPFGTRTVKDFALGFAELSQACFKSSKLDQYSQPLMHILTEGRPDWLVNREIFKTLDQVKAHMKNFHKIALENPALISANSCADFTKDIITGFFV